MRPSEYFRLKPILGIANAVALQYAIEHDSDDRTRRDIFYRAIVRQTGKSRSHARRIVRRWVDEFETRLFSDEPT